MYNLLILNEMKKIGIILVALAMTGFMACKGGQSEQAACCASTEACCKDQPAKEKTVIVARVMVKAGQEKAFIEIASKLVAATRMEEGNLFYTLYQSTENPSEFIFYEEYRDDAAFETHASSAHFAAFAEATNDMMAGELVVDQF
jgi:quinol monooxygenase YgiN